MKKEWIIDGKYRVLDKLGSGGHSVVYLAENVNLKTKWAIKVVPCDNEKINLEKNEGDIIKFLDHPALPRLVDAISDKNFKYYIFDYIEGKNLLEILKKKGSFGENLVIRWAYQILDVLDYLHSQIPAPLIFRDLKPSNLMLTTNDRIKVIDFGAARIYKKKNNNDTVYLGTKGYAAPEQFGSGQTSVETDIYNFGMTLLHLLTGLHPSVYSRDRLINSLNKKKISFEFFNVIIKCIEFSPADRYHSVLEIRDDLERITSVQKAFIESFGNKTCTTVAFVGTSSGCGVTHTCIMLANYLKKRNIKVAVAEFNRTKAFEKMYKVNLGNVYIDAQKEGFVLRGLNFYQFCNMKDLINIPKNKYDFIFIDMGSYKKAIDMDEFMRADINVICGDYSEWKFFDFINFLKNHRFKDKEGYWKYIFLFANKRDISKLKSFLNSKQVFSTPYNRDPFYIKKENINEVDKLIEDLFGMKFYRKKQLF